MTLLIALPTDLESAILDLQKRNSSPKDSIEGCQIQELSTLTKEA